jgi:YbbR domain-containing protein
VTPLREPLVNRKAVGASAPQMKLPQKWQVLLFENGSYKLVALFVTLILWVTILGRRDFITSKDVDIEFLLPKNVVIAESIERRVSVKVSGPRIAIKRFSQNPGAITLDLARAHVGNNRVVITARNVEVPFGVKVISVTPDIINVALAKSLQSLDGREQ